MNRRQLIVIALAGLVALPAVAQDKHWLVGTWKGEIGNNYKGRDGTERTMTIAAVPAGGDIQGSWNAQGKPRIGNAEFKLAGDGKLRGQIRFLKTGKTHPIDMVRE
jgi:hypothetical protein